MKRVKSIELEIHASNMFNLELTFDYNCQTKKKRLTATNTPKIHIKCQNLEDPTWFIEEFKLDVLEHKIWMKNENLPPLKVLSFKFASLNITIL